MSCRTFRKRREIRSGKDLIFYIPPGMRISIQQGMKGILLMEKIPPFTGWKKATWPISGNILWKGIIPGVKRKLPLAQMQKNFWGSGSETRSCCRLPAEIWNIWFLVFMRTTVNLTISWMAAVYI